MKKKYSLLALGIGIITLLLWWAGIGEVAEILKKARGEYLILAVIMYSMSLVTWGLRWRVLLKALDVDAGFTKILLALLAGIFVNNITPGARGGGEPVRMYFLAKETEKPYGQVFATVMMDRILDLVPVIVMLGISTVYVYRLGSLSLTLILVLLDSAFAGLIFFTLGILLSERKTKGALWWFFRLFERLTPKKAEKYRERFEKVVETDVPRFQNDFRFLIKHKGTFALALVYSTASWIFTVLRTYCVFRAINFPISLVDVMVVQMVGIVVGMISVIPGGAGIIETVNSGIYVILGINKEIAVTATLLDRLISYWIPTALGAVVTTHFGAKLRRKGLIRK
ncbi:lysylphosphatidylglycerol synthase transmembrane domain-containing protein [Thermococcus sp.]|uniref:lysylphosphatidylglycerol synthase transmembrane domain-containing protein n=1 Tax=Thermococcus sp. TaxID=35749 RepID=UPI0025D3487B|nr:lysylphosphatidylglycerol synthase transmembrane domain-containing protein [Thermococcus sp.]